MDSSRELVGSIRKEHVGSVSKVSPERATTVVLKPSQSRRVVPAHKHSVGAKGPKQLGQVDGAFNRGKDPVASRVRCFPNLNPLFSGLRNRELGQSFLWVRICVRVWVLWVRA